MLSSRSLNPQFIPVSEPTQKCDIAIETRDTDEGNTSTNDVEHGPNLIIEDPKMNRCFNFLLLRENSQN